MFIRDNHGFRENIICFRHLANNEFAIGFFNPYDKDQTIMLPYYEIGLDPLCKYGLEVRDVMSGEDLGVNEDYFEAKVPAMDCRIFRAKLVKLG